MFSYFGSCVFSHPSCPTFRAKSELGSGEFLSGELLRYPEHWALEIFAKRESGVTFTTPMSKLKRVQFWVSVSNSKTKSKLAQEVLKSFWSSLYPEEDEESSWLANFHTFFVPYLGFELWLLWVVTAKKFNFRGHPLGFTQAKNASQKPTEKFLFLAN